MQRMLVSGRYERSPSPVPERQETRCFPRNLEVNGHLIAFVEASRWPSWVRNLSVNGICLQLNRPGEVGITLDVEMRNVLLGYSTTRRFRVVYAMPMLAGGYILGGVFAQQLSNDQLQALLY